MQHLQDRVHQLEKELANATIEKKKFETRCKKLEEELQRVVHNPNEHTASDRKLGENLGTRLDKGVQTAHDERGMDVC